ncbi:bifunctional glycosyltransferase/CDP-glycerol:glycerophosphate glycerophosphotransferase [Photobacterium lutimaris]|uniref:Capsular biosynthesis protein n=1 Tax=Photobacterium lutimaris TaxID=388278 RepID=A0A2T3INF7_9GAMM|nr:CDP-glycerol glycerophosphotransferase family protein [Photobacterium lutimaris]PSU29851.1 capsular biosynthesis protein [Photobacterium lutimaris]TDR75275.1 CDP-glycerol glycerophosphotransferase (TagB/SpsB family) [Photobacterium lutimaris]
MKKIQNIKKLYSLAKEYNKNKAFNMRKSSYEASLIDPFLLPNTVTYGENKFSIISAVYGVEKYLDKYISTLVKQSLSFLNNIELILVDDGSVDGSADICKKWAEKFPNNIIYHRKENGGQASARNEGLELASHDWVTFIDPDDFVDQHYFENVDDFLIRNKGDDISLVCSNFIFFIENEYAYKDNHPLKYRFTQGERIIKFNKSFSDIQMSASAAFFKKSLISDLKFELVKPDFEDALFVAKYILNNSDSKAVFLPKVKYFYRKREDSSSTLDTVWKKDEKYSAVIKDGYLNLVNYALEQVGYVPNWLQVTLVYATSWYVKYFHQNHSRQSSVTPELQVECLTLLRDLYRHIDRDIILSIKQPSIGLFWLSGICNLLKCSNFEPNNVIVADFDPLYKLICLKFNSSSDLNTITFYSAGEEVESQFYKCQKKEIFGDTFVYEHTCWVELLDGNELKVYNTNKEQINLLLDGLTFSSITNSTILAKRLKLPKHANRNIVTKLYRNLAKSTRYTNRYKNAWLLMDRDIQADDNAEHLYRFMMNSHVKENFYFVLRKNSHDWNRLSSEGFNLIEFGSLDHIMAMLNADFLISSHADRYVTNLLNSSFYSDLLKFKFIFLQHGVTKDDLSEWLNSKNIRQFICAAKPEYESISGMKTNYKFTEYDTALTGFPRHDSLLSYNNQQSRKIVIMPTWRQNLVGYSTSTSNIREKNNSFEQSDYYKTWMSFLRSPRLMKIVSEYNYELIFFPHANVQAYFKSHSIDGVKILGHDDIKSIQMLFGDSALMITDYSSVAFESAYLRKSILYYQFDRDEFFGGGHVYQPGYFDYIRDGFGPVCVDEASILDQIESLVKNNCEPLSPYRERIEQFFPFRDGKCSERVYELIRKS